MDSKQHYHIAQLNIGRIVAPLNDPIMADFANNLNQINQLGANTPGFVWQLLSDEGDSTAFRILNDDSLFVNFTVWETIDALFDFAYKSQHVEFFRRRREWFTKMEDLPVLTLWWIPANHTPTLEEAQEKLLYHREHGPTPLAFTFKERFTPDEMLEALQHSSSAGD